MASTTTSSLSALYAKAQTSAESSGAGVLRAIQQAASRTGVDFSYLLHKANQESGLNPSAKASTSSASGLFQFINQTWLRMIKDKGASYGLGQEAAAISLKNGKADVADPAMREKILNLRHDPVLASAMAAEFTRDNKDYLDAAVGGRIGSTELYMAHFLGAGGAAKFLNAMRSAPETTGTALFPEAASANKTVFYDKGGRALALKDIYARFAAKFDDGALANRMMAKADTAAGVAGTSSAFDLGRRDVAALSPAFFRLPAEISDALRQGNTTSDTLFNVMVMAQKGLTDALSHDAYVQPSRRAYS